MKYQTLKNFGNELYEWFVILFAIGYVVFIALLVMQILAPLSPVFTLLFAIVGTVATFDRWQYALISLLGIGLYILSWPISVCCSMLLSLFVCGCGVIAWFWAFLSVMIKPNFAY